MILYHVVCACPLGYRWFIVSINHFRNNNYQHTILFRKKTRTWDPGD